jgi:hypothetical protein
MSKSQFIWYMLCQWGKNLLSLLKYILYHWIQGEQGFLKRGKNGRSQQL